MPENHPDDLNAIIEAYQELRTRCHELARADDGELMGNDRWLRHALSERDIELTAGGDGLECHGSAYTTQTMSNEYFSFTIPYSALATTTV